MSRPLASRRIAPVAAGAGAAAPLREALRGLFRQARAKRLLRQSFASWCEYRRNSRRAHWAQSRVAMCEARRTKRQVFRAWVAGVTFLAWSTPRTRLLEQRAAVFFWARLLRAWREAARRGAGVAHASVEQP